jgi:hypothetical protein
VTGWVDKIDKESESVREETTYGSYLIAQQEFKFKGEGLSTTCTELECNV